MMRITINVTEESTSVDMAIEGTTQDILRLIGLLHTIQNQLAKEYETKTITIQKENKNEEEAYDR